MTRRLLAALACVVLALTTLTGSAAAAASCPPPTIAAHRGGDYYTESTARNFTASAKAGAKVWETDVRFGRTNYPYLLHDPDLGLFGSSALIADSTGTQIAALRAADGSQVETVWDLGQQLLATPGQTALIELKVMPTAAQWVLFNARVHTAKLLPRVWIASFDPATVQAAQAFGYQTAQIDASTTHRTAAQVRALGTAYEAEYTLLTPTFAAQLKAAGVTVYAWTSDTTTAWRTDGSVGAVPLTDAPSTYLAWYRSNGCSA